MVAVEYLRRRLKLLNLTEDQVNAILRELAGYFFRPARLSFLVPGVNDKKRPYVLERMIACDEAEQVCVHCQLAWDLLRIAKRGTSPWSRYWDDALARKERMLASKKKRDERRTI